MHELVSLPLTWWPKSNNDCDEDDDYNDENAEEESINENEHNIAEDNPINTGFARNKDLYTLMNPRVDSIMFRSI